MKTQQQNLWGATKANLRGKFVVTMPTLQNEANLKNFPLHFKELEIEEQTKPKVSRKKEITKRRKERNEVEAWKTIEKINETKSLFF